MPDHGGAVRRALIAVGLRVLPAWDRFLMLFSDTKEHQVFPTKADVRDLECIRHNRHPMRAVL
jgi:hypothetical protein